ncbi:hypothetical protein IMY05_005G0180200 [Salix suchowensis]|nr:hypothetical protein IMY05_005G0180200 [Salix suchowensis]
MHGSMVKRFKLSLLAFNATIVPCQPEKQPKKQGKNPQKISFLILHPIIQEKNSLKGLLSCVFSLKDTIYGLNPSRDSIVRRSSNCFKLSNLLPSKRC